MKREILDVAFLLVVCFPADAIHRFYIGGCFMFILFSLMNIPNSHLLFYIMKKKNLDSSIHITVYSKKQFSPQYLESNHFPLHKKGSVSKYS